MRDEFVKVCFSEFVVKEAFMVWCLILDESNKLHTFAVIDNDSEPSFLVSLNVSIEKETAIKVSTENTFSFHD